MFEWDRGCGMPEADSDLPSCEASEAKRRTILRNSSICPYTGSFLRDSRIFLYCGVCGSLVKGLNSLPCEGHK